jgi:hypothetical protein
MDKEVICTKRSGGVLLPSFSAGVGFSLFVLVGRASKSKVKSFGVGCCSVGRRFFVARGLVKVVAPFQGSSVHGLGLFKFSKTISWAFNCIQFIPTGRQAIGGSANLDDGSWHPSVPSVIPYDTCTVYTYILN